VKLKTTILYKKTEAIKLELAYVDCLCNFFIENFEEVVKNVDGILTIPEQFIPPTFGIAVSTARGMLSVLLRGSKISNAVIPIINPQQMFLSQAKQIETK
jgi:hypothetical protein